MSHKIYPKHLKLKPSCRSLHLDTLLSIKTKAMCGYQLEQIKAKLEQYIS